MKKRVLIVAGVAVGAALVLGATLFAGVGVVQAAARVGRSLIANRMDLALDNVQAPSNEKGVVVVIVASGSPADTAGVKRGDILLKIDNQEVNTPADLANYLKSMKSGDKVQLSLTHGDTARTLSATLGDKNGRAYLGLLPFGGFFGRGGKFPGFGTPISGTHVMVTEVITGSPADTAGIKTGDVILSMDGKAFRPNETLSEIISSHKPGDKVTLSVQHSGDANPTDVQVTLGDNPNKAGQAYLGVQYRMGGRFGVGMGRFRGWSFPIPGTPNNTPPGQQVPFGGVTQTISGAIVFQVTPDSPASAAGLKRGDVITAIDGKTIQNAQALVDAIAAHKPGDKVMLTVQQLGSKQTSDITATLGDNPNKAGTAWLGVMLGDATNMPRGFGGQGAPRFNFPGRPGNRNQTPQQGTGVGNTL
ncbi:MAG: PDZ domain-containing protein [Chloroflexi bacterium]|nr:PDZ domain-containing protein [Chloroflexota bacterium]MCL5275414.1 PDZ domain-containing protein [Chloroflexota bacterium]